MNVKNEVAIRKEITPGYFGFVLLSLVFLMLTGCTLSGCHAQKEPSMLTISAGEMMVQAVRTTYSWQSGNTGIDSDGLHPLDMAKELPVLAIPKDAIVDFIFDTAPDQIEILAWRSSAAGMGNYDEPDFKFSLLSEHTVKLPSDDRYLYSVHAVWEKKNEIGGDAYYGFASAPKE